MKHIFRVMLALMLLVFPAGTMFSSSLGVGSQSCPTAGAKQLSTTNTPAIWINIQALSGNSGTIWYGGSAVTTSKGSYLFPAGTGYISSGSQNAGLNLSATYIACTNSGDSVTYTYLQ